MVRFITAAARPDRAPRCGGRAPGAIGRRAAITFVMCSSELHADQLEALAHVVAVDAGGERLLLQLLLHRRRLQRRDAVRPHEPAGVDEAGQLVAGEQRLLERRRALQVEVVRVRQDGAHEPLRIPALEQHRPAVLRVLVERRMHLVVEIVQQRDVAPGRLVLAVQARVVPHRGLDGERVPQQRLALRELRAAATTRRRGHGRDRSSGGMVGEERLVAWPPVATIEARQAVTEYFVIEGGRPLSGTIAPEGNKNAALPIIAAALLTDRVVRLSNVPRIRDVEVMCRAGRRSRRERRVDGTERPRDPGRVRLEDDARPRRSAAASARRSCSPARCSRAAAR